MPFLYEDDLKKTLTKFNDILDKLDVLDMQKDEIREGIREFIRINKIEEVDIRDTNNQLWRIGISTRSRKSINHELLEQYLDDDALSKIITESENECLTAKRVKQRKKKARPKAPSMVPIEKQSQTVLKEYLKENNV